MGSKTALRKGLPANNHLAVFFLLDFITNPARLGSDK